MLRNYIFKKNSFTVFAYIIAILLMLSGGLDPVFEKFTIILIFFTLISGLYLLLKKKNYHLFLIYHFFLIFFVLFFTLEGNSNFMPRFLGGDFYDSASVGTLKLLFKIIILFVFFPINSDDIKVKLARAMSFLILFFFLQATLITFAVNIIKIPINEMQLLSPLLGNVTDWEPYPLRVFDSNSDFEYYRPRSYFMEPSAFGYVILVLFFTRLILGGGGEFKNIIFNICNNYNYHI